MILEKFLTEIKGLEKENNHRAAQEIFNMLDRNQNLFLKKMDAADFRSLHKNFEELADYHPSEYSSERFKDDYARAYSILRYYLEKII
jgi:hypothetical protein